MREGRGRIRGIDWYWKWYAEDAEKKVGGADRLYGINAFKIAYEVRLLVCQSGSRTLDVKSRIRGRQEK